MAKCNYCGAEGMTCIYGQAHLCEPCTGKARTVALRIWDALKELVRRFMEWLRSDRFKQLVKVFERDQAENRETVTATYQRRESFAPQFPPLPPLPSGRAVVPRARRNLPAGMRRRCEGE